MFNFLNHVHCHANRSPSERFRVQHSKKTIAVLSVYYIRQL